MEIPVYIRWAIVGAALIVIGALNVNIGRRAAGSIAPLLFRLAWLVMWVLIVLGVWILVHSLFFLER